MNPPKDATHSVRRPHEGPDEGHWFSSINQGLKNKKGGSWCLYGLYDVKSLLKDGFIVETVNRDLENK